MSLKYEPASVQVGEVRVPPGARAQHDQLQLLYGQPTGPNPLYHRDDEVDRPCAMAF